VAGRDDKNDCGEGALWRRIGVEQVEEGVKIDVAGVTGDGQSLFESVESELDELAEDDRPRFIGVLIAASMPAWERRDVISCCSRTYSSSCLAVSVSMAHVR